MLVGQMLAVHRNLVIASVHHPGFVDSISRVCASLASQIAATRMVEDSGLLESDNGLSCRFGVPTPGLK